MPTSTRRLDRFFRRTYEPIAYPDEIIALDTGTTLKTDNSDTPFFLVQRILSTGDAFGVKGLNVVWSATAACAPPYALDPNIGGAAGVEIQAAAGSQPGLSPLVVPAFATLQSHQVMQLRTLCRTLKDSNGVVPTGVPNDYALWLYSPQGVRAFGTQVQNGEIAPALQGSMPMDVQFAPAQGANYSIPTAPQSDPFDLAQASELFIYGNSNGNLGVQVANYGSAAASTGAVAMQCKGFIYQLAPVPAGASAKTQWCHGYENILVPGDVNPSDVIYFPIGAGITPN